MKSAAGKNKPDETEHLPFQLTTPPRAERRCSGLVKPGEFFVKLFSENTGSFFVICDLEGRLQYAQIPLEIGFENRDWRGKDLTGLYNPFMAKRVLKDIKQVAATGQPLTVERYLVARGKKLWFANQMGPLPNPAGQVEAVGIIGTNITERRESDQKVKKQTIHDKVTGLYNRAFLEEELKKLEKSQEFPFCIVVGDLNGLKFINDTYGHKTGDRVLKKAARLLLETCREKDLVARTGGDEFVILMPRATFQHAEEVCQRIKKRFARAGSKPVQLSIALGYAVKDALSKSVPEIFKEADARMYRNKLLEQKSSYGSLIASLQNTLYEKSQETEEHAVRLRTLAHQMGKALKFPPHEMDNLDLLATLHDIGKIAIPEELLLKAGPLTPTEFKIMQTHSEVGYRIARTNAHLTQVAEGILAHHERWDGAGYPRGLKGGKIPLIARIIAIIDSYDAMTHDRVYRKAVDPAEALLEMQRCAGGQFDPELVKTFLELFNFYQI